MTGTAHGNAEAYFLFIDTKIAHGTVPAMLTMLPVRIARTRMGV
jgi:hypothetical protein